MSKINLISTGQSAITLPRGREVPAVAGTPFQLDSMADAEWLVRAGAAEIVSVPKAEGQIDVTKLSIKDLKVHLSAVDIAEAVQELLDAEIASGRPRAGVVKLLEAHLAKLAAGDQSGQNDGDSASTGGGAAEPGDTAAGAGNDTASIDGDDTAANGSDGPATPDGDDGTGAIGPDGPATPDGDDGTGAIGPDDAATPAPDDDGVTANAQTAPAGDDATNPDSTTNE